MIHIGDCRTILRTLPERSVQCCVTSPPYFGLRDYGMAEQIGAEPTPDAFVAELVAVFREVRRVLADDGTLWLNLGDSYAANRGSGARGIGAKQATNEGANLGKLSVPAGFKEKDLMGIPWRVAFALQADGWYLRQEIIWHKPNPMPESVTDRCTKSHEHIFLLTKSARYYFDNEAIKEPLAESSIARLSQDVDAQEGSDRVPGKTNGKMKAVRFGGNKYGDDASEQSRTKSGNEWKPRPSGTQHKQAAMRQNAGPSSGLGSNDPFESRNKRTVWTVPTMPFKEAHFATYPPALIEPCILAGSRAGDTVLDPFMGAGTTAVVCESLGRRWIGCELNPAYAEIANKRIRATQPGLPFGAVA
jgi:DNA modification methylase